MKHPVYRVGLTLMYGCGLRIGEVLSLQPQHVDRQRGILRVIGKGNSERLLPLSASLLEAMSHAWRAHRNRQWVFAIPSTGNPLHRNTLARALKIAGAQVGIFGVTPHSLRHAFATRLLERNVELRVVQVLLGHARLSTTEIYTHVTEPLRQQVRPKLEELIRGLV